MDESSSSVLQPAPPLYPFSPSFIHSSVCPPPSPLHVSAFLGSLAVSPPRLCSPDWSLWRPSSSESRLTIPIAFPRVPSSKPLAGNGGYPSMHRARLLSDVLPARKSLEENRVEAFSLELFDEVTASQSKGSREFPDVTVGPRLSPRFDLLSSLASLR